MNERATMTFDANVKSFFITQLQFSSVIDILHATTIKCSARRCPCAAASTIWKEIEMITEM